MKNKSGYDDILRHENEITKMKIQAEFGLELNDNEGLNPAIENIWLNQILDYERAMVNNKQITVGEKIGNPVCKPVTEINDEELTGELQSVMDILRQKNIVVESIDGVDDRELYRFIIEELFLAETDSNVPGNMITCFIYEEFHPNDEADIRKHSLEFLNLLVKTENNYFEKYISSGIDEDKEVALENLKFKLILFRDAYDEIRINKFNIDAVNIYDEKAEVNFEFRLSVLPPDGKKFQPLSGYGRFDFINEYDYWVIEGIVMDGIV